MLSQNINLSLHYYTARRLSYNEYDTVLNSLLKFYENGLSEFCRKALQFIL